MNIADLPDDSETSDEDYVPEGTNVELPSEEESDGDVEEDLPTRAGNKRQKKLGKPKKKHKIHDEETPKPEEKQATDSLWADFMKDTGFKTRAERSQTSTQTPEIVQPKETKSEQQQTRQPQKKKVLEIYKFAGEEVKIEKEISEESPSGSSIKPPSGRLNSFLNNLGKKRKINTLEKSKLDWDQFKKDEKIEDELQAYGKSKDGYLEKQDFLERADLRRFEIEKGIRNTLRNNRMNNVNM